MTRCKKKASCKLPLSHLPPLRAPHANAPVVPGARNERRAAAAASDAADGSHGHARVAARESCERRRAQHGCAAAGVHDADGAVTGAARKGAAREGAEAEAAGAELVALNVGAADLDFAFGDKAFFRGAYEDAKGRRRAAR